MKAHLPIEASQKKMVKKIYRCIKRASAMSDKYNKAPNPELKKNLGIIAQAVTILINSLSPVERYYLDQLAEEKKCGDNCVKVRL